MVVEPSRPSREMMSEQGLAGRACLGLAAAERDLHHIGHIANRQTIGCNRRPVEIDHKRRQSFGLLNLDIRSTVDRAQRSCNALRRGIECFKIIAIDLDRYIGSNARNQLVKAHLDGLAELIIVAEQRVQPGFHPGNQRGLWFGRIGPLLSWVQDHESVGHVAGHRVSRHFRRARL